jgi:glycosyltransferase involved in cell wall biosynthesis
VIAAEAGGIPGVVDNGKNGILVPFGDISSLANAIQLLTIDQKLNRALGENGYQKLMENYTWERVTDRVLDAYGDVLLIRNHEGESPRLPVRFG